jgi:hypothetical protein
VSWSRILEGLALAWLSACPFGFIGWSELEALS